MSDTPQENALLPEALRFQSPAPLVDIGANLTHESFGRDLEATLERAQAANVTALIVTGADLEGARHAAALAERHAPLYATAGVHPHHASAWNAEMEAAMLELQRQPRVVAVGECGLDFNRNFSAPRDQERAFEAQLALAVESGLPLFLHERDAGKRMLEMLREWRDHLSDAVVHCFTGERKTLHGYLDLDLHIGQTGWLCDERRGHHLREFVADIPADRLMVETDCPYLLPRNLPAKLKGRRHEPALLPWIVKELAHWRGESEAELARRTTQTARRFFRLDNVPDTGRPGSAPTGGASA
ncbi:TatD family hydrolase [Salinicola rhizosphaerae]|uniref:Preprotein translocase subunit TatD n=1 Tax=Salinicola rhizosphaerae TaxID=1443141 RepID=A0ABQ3DP75_9GAMM|nr:TatD family hydrolase [Salinicola rhizosphaerae]GHB07075.1 preprotein translocase subunit TatD [Salinicola rhizosphaerae]